MSHENKVEASGVKQFLAENLWFILLLTPLLVVAIFVLQSVEFGSKKQSSNRGLVTVVGNVEVSAVELASIVAKPFTQLLAMDIYANSNSRYQRGTIASLSKADFRQVAYKHSYDRQSVNYQANKLISYEIYSNDKHKKREKKS